MARRRILLFVLGAALVGVVGVGLVLGWRAADRPSVVTDPVVSVPPVARRIVDADDRGALVLGDGRLQAFDVAGRPRWSVGSTGGGARCLACPVALVGIGAPDGPERVDGSGAHTPARDLAGALTLGDVWLRPDGDALRVLVPTATATVELGRLPARTLDPSAYAFAPSVAVATDGRSGAAVVGVPDPLETGRAEGWYLRVGAPPRSVPIELAGPGTTPGVCRPQPGTDRWGWVETFPGDEPWLGSARFVPVAGAATLDPVRLDLPVSTCTTTAEGYVLTFTSSGPGGTSAGAIWVDRTGRVVRRAATRDERTQGSASVSDATGRVLLPVGGGARLGDADGERGRIVADDARLSPDGHIWVARGRRIARVDGP